MSLALFTKDPDAQLDYGFDWTAYLNGNTITASDWLIPSGLTLVSQAFNTTTATVVISGGTLAKSYNITNQITVSDGTLDQRSLTILIQQK